MIGQSRRQSFTLLEQGKPPLRAFGASTMLQSFVLLLLIWLPALLPEKMVAKTQYWVTQIAAPPVVEWKPQPKPEVKPKPEPKLEVKKPEPKPEELVAPPKPKNTELFASLVAPQPIRKKKTVQPTNAPDPGDPAPPRPVLPSMGSSQMPTIKKPRAQVQTGGFGDPNGLTGTPIPGKVPNGAHQGSYNLPPGPGYGNGTGGKNGVPGVIASAGFGNGIATGGSGGGGGRGGVKVGGFATETSGPETPKVKPANVSTAPTTPVEILYKPTPAYTQQARDLKIEGEVLLDVIFGANGQIDVLRVQRGLGYGLDETAIAAAKQIRFKPAHREGQPVDFRATVHIVYQLAY